MNSKDEILEEISNDLKILKYEGEDLVSYKSRVIYSALSNWVKISTLDIDILNDVQRNIGQSREYISNKASIFLQNIIDIFPEVYPWFYPNDIKDKPEKIIIDRLKNAGEIIKSGFNSYLALPIYEECIVDNKTKVTRGIENKKIEMCTGLTQLKYSEVSYEVDKNRLFDFYGVENQTAKEMWDRYINQVTWNKRTDISCPIFNKNSKVAFYKSWDDDYKLNDGEISIYKENFSDYGIIKKINNEIYTNQFNHAIIDNFEIRRFMYGLKYEANNPVKVDYKYLNNKKLVELSLKCTLPNHETNILLALGWPKNSILDTKNLIFSIHVWEFIKIILENLNIIVREID